MNKLKYTLDKSSRKFICPKCNKKRFVRYVEIETNNYLEESLGRCDSESSCGYFKKVAHNTISNIDTLKTNYNFRKEPILVPSFHSNSDLLQTLRKYDQNNFYIYLNTLFQKDDIIKVFKDYRIGTSKTWNGSTVFWQTDHQNNIRAGKILLFDKINCKRVRKPYKHITWAHKKMRLEPFNLKQCLFGLHLMDAAKTIALVESEKTAIIMKLFMPEYIWMATGSKQNFKNELLIPIKNQDIIAFPDKSEFNDWQKKADELNKHGFSIKVSDYLENIDCEEGSDLADIYIALRNKKLTLEELTTDEKTIISLAKVNSNLLLLIETFDLLDLSDNSIDIEKLNEFL